jgi:hypothetical protein
MRSDKKTSFGCWPGKLIKMSDLAEEFYGHFVNLSININFISVTSIIFISLSCTPSLLRKFGVGFKGKIELVLTKLSMPSIDLLK